MKDHRGGEPSPGRAPTRRRPLPLWYLLIALLTPGCGEATVDRGPERPLPELPPTVSMDGGIVLLEGLRYSSGFPRGALLTEDGRSVLLLSHDALACFDSLGVRQDVPVPPPATFLRAAHGSRPGSFYLSEPPGGAIVEMECSGEVLARWAPGAGSAGRVAVGPDWSEKGPLVHRALPSREEGEWRIRRQRVWALAGEEPDEIVEGAPMYVAGPGSVGVPRPLAPLIEVRARAGGLWVLSESHPAPVVRLAREGRLEIPAPWPGPSVASEDVEAWVGELTWGWPRGEWGGIRAMSAGLVPTDTVAVIRSVRPDTDGSAWLRVWNPRDPARELWLHYPEGRVDPAAALELDLGSRLLDIGGGHALVGHDGSRGVELRVHRLEGGGSSDVLEPDGE